MEVFLFSLFNGIQYGLLLFMLSSGLTLIFSMMGVLNFAHASFYMLGAYFAYQISEILNYWLPRALPPDLVIYFDFWPALIIAPLIVGTVGALVERYGLRVVHKFGHVAELLFTFGLAYVMEEVIQMIWGKADMPYRVPASMNYALFNWQGLDYSAYRIFMVFISLAIFIALYGILSRTRVGVIIRASLTYPDIVGSLGHNVPLIFMLVFGFGSALAGIAGVLSGNLLGTNPAMALQLGPIVFVVIVIGGLGSLWGAFIASLFIGSVTNLFISYDFSFQEFFLLLGVQQEAEGLGADLLKMTSGSISPVIPYLLLVVILITRPRGLFGTRDV